MRKTIGTNPLDAVVPDLSTVSQSTRSGNSRTNNGAQSNAIGSNANDGTANGSIGKALAPLRPSKERLTVHISVPLIERAKNAVFWTPGLTLADLGERALETLVSELEKQNGRPFEPRPHELKGGRPLK